MADQLTTTADLAALLQVDVAELHTDGAVAAIEAATSVVQAATGQRLIAVDTDTAVLVAGVGPWLSLPERPVTVVTAVRLDGVLLTEGITCGTYRVIRDRLWRDTGWTHERFAPSLVTVDYGHGLAAAAQDLQLARSAVLMLTRSVYGNPGAATREQIDDYSVAYETASAALDNSPALRAALRRQYGKRAGLVGVG